MKMSKENINEHKEQKIYNYSQLILIEHICNNDVEVWVREHAEQFCEFYRQNYSESGENSVLAIVNQYKEFCKHVFEIFEGETNGKKIAE